MRSHMGIAMELFDTGHPKEGQEWLDSLPEGGRFQLAPWFDDVQKVCAHRIEAEPVRRPVNGLNIEWSFEHKRCLRQSPDGRGLAYWASGGDVIAYGACCLVNCPIGRKALP